MADILRDHMRGRELSREQVVDIATRAYQHAPASRDGLNWSTVRPDFCPRGRQECGVNLPIYSEGPRSIYACRTHAVAWTCSWAPNEVDPREVMLQSLIEADVIKAEDFAR